MRAQRLGASEAESRLWAGLVPKELGVGAFARGADSQHREDA